ncbi:hypothetical protein A6R68_17885, partial [Neotoma lepida]
IRKLTLVLGLPSKPTVCKENILQSYWELIQQPLEDSQSFQSSQVTRESFKAADLDLDWTGTWKEFITFLHPEEFEHMKEIVVSETLVNINKNWAGFVNQDEYIIDIFPMRTMVLTQIGF